MLVSVPGIDAEPVKTLMLAMSNMGDEASFTAATHVTYITTVLESYNLAPSDVLAFIADNTSTNKAVARSFGGLGADSACMIGCASHKLNLAVKRYLKVDFPEYESLLREISELMNVLLHSKNAGEMRKRIRVGAIKRFQVRWTGDFAMVERYIMLRPHLNRTNPEIAAVCLTAEDEIVVDKMFRIMEHFRDATKLLQLAPTTLSTARTCFDRLLERFPSMAHHLGATADIVQNSDFDSGVVKLQTGKSAELTEAEKLLMARFKKAVHEVEEEEAVVEGEGAVRSPGMFDDMFGKKRKHPTGGAGADVASVYADVDWIPATSNVCERLFSRAQKILGDLRHRLDPERLEQLLLLTVNRDLWNLTTISNIVDDPENHF